MSHQCPLCDFSSDNAYDLFVHCAKSTRGQRQGQHRTYSEAQNVADMLGISKQEYSRGFPDISGHFDIGGIPVVVHGRYVNQPVQAGRKAFHGSSHRIYVTCPKCHRGIPAGRIHQHIQAASHR